MLYNADMCKSTLNMGKNMFLFSGCKGGENVKELKINIVKILFKKSCASQLL